MAKRTRTARGRRAPAEDVDAAAVAEQLQAQGVTARAVDERTVVVGALDPSDEAERRSLEDDGADALRAFVAALGPMGSLGVQEAAGNGKPDEAALRAFMASRVRLARRALYLSQAELGAWVGLGETTIGNIEAARQFPSQRLLWLLAAAVRRRYGWTLDWFFGVDAMEQLARLGR
jgi:DNA-binding XRE family transcriptional regulator